MRVYKIKISEGGSAIIVETEKEVQDNIEGLELDNMEIGETLTIEVSEMDEEEFNNLPAFEGF